MLKVVGASWQQTKIICYCLGTLAVLAIMALFLLEFDKEIEDGNFAATVFWDPKTRSHDITFWRQGNDLADIPRGAARGYFRQDIETTGWSHLEIETNPDYPDEVQAFAAGLLEGALTWEQIYSHYLNIIETPCLGKEKECNKIKDTLVKSFVEMSNDVAAYEDFDPFWHQIRLHFEQISGIQSGWIYSARRAQQEYEMEDSDFFWLNSITDIKGIRNHLKLKTNESLVDESPPSSSAFFKLVNETNGNEIKRNVFVAHNAAGSYNSMLRILKRYKLNFRASDDPESLFVVNNLVEFSGYPGSITSLDDMYIVGNNNVHKYAITGTALNIYNRDLWKKINIMDQVPLAPRLAAANRLATNISSWSHLMSYQNSGTASKQWMIVDFRYLNVVIQTLNSTNQEHMHNIDVISNHSDVNKNISGSTTHGLVMLLEQIPGRTHYADITEILLKRGYFATYGLPYFAVISEDTHIAKKELHDNILFSVKHSPKAKIFEKISQNATNINTIIDIMRSANLTQLAEIVLNECTQRELFAEKPLCQMKDNHFWYGLAVRGDLSKRHPEAYGVIDTKVFEADSTGVVKHFIAISGPTFTKKKLKLKSGSPINKGNIVEVTTLPLMAENQVKSSNENELIKPFVWSKSEFTNIPHQGLPDVFEFEPTNPTWHW